MAFLAADAIEHAVLGLESTPPVVIALGALLHAVFGAAASLHWLRFTDSIALPATPGTVVFLFNPFGAATLSAVVTNLAASLQQAPRRLMVVYFNPAHRNVLDDSGAFRPTATVRHWLLHEPA